MPEFKRVQGLDSINVSSLTTDELHGLYGLIVAELSQRQYSRGGWGKQSNSGHWYPLQQPILPEAPLAPPGPK